MDAASRTIAVLPFEDLGGDPDRAWLARGLAEDLIGELSRFPQLEVIHVHGSFADDLRGLTEHAIGRELGARYVPRGTVRRAGGRLVVSTRLVDATTGRQVAAELEAAEAELPASTEKARTAVTWRIRSAVRKVAAAHPAPGRHLEHSVRTGTRCSYEPEQPVAWLT